MNNVVGDPNVIALAGEQADKIKSTYVGGLPKIETVVQAAPAVDGVPTSTLETFDTPAATETVNVAPAATADTATSGIDDFLSTVGREAVGATSVGASVMPVTPVVQATSEIPADASETFGSKSFDSSESVMDSTAPVDDMSNYLNDVTALSLEELYKEMDVTNGKVMSLNAQAQDIHDQINAGLMYYKRLFDELKKRKALNTTELATIPQVNSSDDPASKVNEDMLNFGSGYMFDEGNMFDAPVASNGGMSMW